GSISTIIVSRSWGTTPYSPTPGVLPGPSFGWLLNEFGFSMEDRFIRPDSVIATATAVTITSSSSPRSWPTWMIVFRCDACVGRSPSNCPADRPGAVGAYSDSTVGVSGPAVGSALPHPLSDNASAPDNRTPIPTLL